MLSGCTVICPLAVELICAILCSPKLGREVAGDIRLIPKKGLIKEGIDALALAFNGDDAHLLLIFARLRDHWGSIAQSGCVIRVNEPEEHQIGVLAAQGEVVNRVRPGLECCGQAVGIVTSWVKHENIFI